MASSEHTLKLKAVLDTSQVRGQLNQIRNQANQALGSQRQRLQDSGSAGTGNIAQLNTTLRNLQASIDRLNQAIARNFAYGRQPISAGSGSAAAAAAAAAGGLGSVALNSGRFDVLKNASTKPYVSQFAGTIRNKPFGQYVINDSIMRRMLESGWTSADIGGYVIKNFKTLQKQWKAQLKEFGLANSGLTPAQDAAMEKIFNRRLRAKYGDPNAAAAGLPAGVQLSDSKYNKVLSRSLIAYGASHLAMSGQEYAEAAGYSGVGKALGFGGYVAGGALAGSIGGPAGIAIGAAVGGLSYALKELAESAKKTSSALAESEARVKSARQVQYGWLDFQRQRIDAEAAKRNDGAHFISQQAIAKSEADFYRSQLEGSVIGSADPQALREFESKTQQYLKDKTISADQAGARNKIANQWKDTFTQMQKALQLADSYKDKVEAIEKANTKNLESKQKELEAFEKQEGLATNLEKYAGNTAKLSDLAKTSKLNLDIAKGAYSSLLKSQDVSESGLDNLATARTRMQQAQQEYQAYANALRQSEASDAQKATAQAAQLLAAKQGELSQLQKRLGSLSAPNLGQVTSLASSGLMISKKDDDIRIQTQEGFEREQTSIQRQILQKMDEITALESTATYS